MNAFQRFSQKLGMWLNQRRGTARPNAALQGATSGNPSHIVDPFPIAENDPLLAYLEQISSAVDVSDIPVPEASSPALQAARANGVHMLVPLISQGELVAVLSLGEQMSERDYSREDRELLNLLATQAAPAFVVGELVREREEAARLRERDEQEMRIAHQIQLALLPKVLPQIRDWSLLPSYKPARAVGGDFYDFIDLPDHKLGLFIGDVSSKGVPAALLMATTRSILRGIARQPIGPSEVLRQANEALVQEMPHGMFITCFYGVVDTITGEFVFANAGHLMPFHRRGHTVVELKARGMPLGLMPAMQYEEVRAQFRPSDEVVFYSDGLIEAHNGSAKGEMFGWQRTLQVMADAPDHTDLNQRLLDALDRFVGPDWEQEDDITLLTLAWAAKPMQSIISESPLASTASAQLLLETEIASAVGNERLAMQQVEATLASLTLPRPLLDRIGTAVGEACMNAMEHGNQYRADQPTTLRVWLDNAGANTTNQSQPGRLRIQIIDHGSATLAEPPAPNLDAKLAGLQSPRGWGLFLIRNMVDEMQHSSVDLPQHGGEGPHHMLELVFNLPRGIEHYERDKSNF